jgi:hypothetical protein
VSWEWQIVTCVSNTGQDRHSISSHPPLSHTLDRLRTCAQTQPIIAYIHMYNDWLKRNFRKKNYGHSFLSLDYEQKNYRSQNMKKKNSWLHRNTTHLYIFSIIFENMYVNKPDYQNRLRMTDFWTFGHIYFLWRISLKNRQAWKNSFVHVCL